MPLEVERLELRQQRLPPSGRSGDQPVNLGEDFDEDFLVGVFPGNSLLRRSGKQSLAPSVLPLPLDRLTKGGGDVGREHQGQ